mgnify:CR=1 FL=1
MKYQSGYSDCPPGKCVFVEDPYRHRLVCVRCGKEHSMVDDDRLGLGSLLLTLVSAGILVLLFL